MLIYTSIKRQVDKRLDIEIQERGIPKASWEVAAFGGEGRPARVPLGMTLPLID